MDAKIVLLDTHAWIWWASSSPSLSKQASQSIHRAERIYLSAMSLWEVAMLVKKDRLFLDRDVEIWLDTALKLPRLEVVSITPKIAVRSTRLGEEFTGDPVDCLLAATALEFGCPIISKDSRISTLQKIKTIW